jgi:hypothetical protein
LEQYSAFNRKKYSAATEQRNSMKTITAITWDESRNYTRVEIPWPEEGDERKPSPKPPDMGIPETDLASPTPEPSVVETE